jgi:thiamine pyrophosphokinase
MPTFVVAGSPQASAPAGLAPGPEDQVIAADRGAAHALAWGWPVHLLVGDLDSLPGNVVEQLRVAGVPAITAPRAKDETDLELAIAHALSRDAHEIILCAALGGRTDHMLANILLLVRPELASVEVTIVEGQESVRLLRGETQDGEPASLTLSGKPGDQLSLLPVGGDAVGVATEGLVYPLRDETLFFGQARGVSNLFATATARVSLRSGLLLVIQGSRDERAIEI